MAKSKEERERIARRVEDARKRNPERFKKKEEENRKLRAKRKNPQPPPKAQAKKRNTQVAIGVLERHQVANDPTKLRKRRR